MVLVVAFIPAVVAAPPACTLEAVSAPGLDELGAEDACRRTRLTAGFRGRGWTRVGRCFVLDAGKGSIMGDVLAEFEDEWATEIR